MACSRLRFNKIFVTKAVHLRHVILTLGKLFRHVHFTFCDVFSQFSVIFLFETNILFIGIFVYINSLMRLLGAVTASQVLHLGILSNVIQSPMSFFDTTPSGRIVNRFSKDLDTLDTVIPMIVGMFLNCFFQTVSTILVISFSTPMFLVVILPLLIFYYFVQVFIHSSYGTHGS